MLKDQRLNISSTYKKILKRISKIKGSKEVICTIDVSQSKPTLVKSSKVVEYHSDGNLENAFDFLTVMPKVILVDLDAAIAKE